VDIVIGTVKVICSMISSGMLPITLAACWHPSLTFLHGHPRVHRVTMTWSYQERVGRLVTGLSLLPHPVLGIGCRPTWNSCIRLHHSRANWRVFCSWCLCHQSDCRRCTTSHLCYCYNMLRNTLPRRKLHFYQTMTCDFHPFWQCDAGQIPLLSVPTQSTV